MRQGVEEGVGDRLEDEGLKIKEDLEVLKDGIQKVENLEDGSKRHDLQIADLCPAGEHLLTAVGTWLGQMP